MAGKKNGNDSDESESDHEQGMKGHENDTDDSEQDDSLKDQSTKTTTTTSEAEKTKKTKKKKVHRLSLERTEDFNEKLRKRGVLYVARVPPRMTPSKIKTLLSDFGEITRVYLVEEDTSVRKRRRKNGGSGSKRYVEGWVEFAKKKIAKQVAANLNNKSISNFKRSVHYGDLWNLKYLHRFQWSHLTEKVAYERRVREQKLRVEMMQARKENVAYTELVETGKKLDKIAERKRRRAEKEGKGTGGDTVVGTGGNGGVDEQPNKRRKPRQNKPMEEGSSRATKKALLGSLVS